MRASFAADGPFMASGGKLQPIPTGPSRSGQQAPDGLGDGDITLMKDPIPRVRRATDLMSVILQDAGVRANSAVRVTGKDGLAPLIWLCRRGFQDVAYVRPGQGGPQDPGDVLLVLHNTPPDELERLLNDRPPVREGGLLIVQTPALPAADGRDPIHLILESAGYAVERCIPRRSHEVHVARRRARTDDQKAA